MLNVGLYVFVRLCDFFCCVNIVGDDEVKCCCSLAVVD